jgi:hypothetical protein
MSVERSDLARSGIHDPDAQRSQLSRNGRRWRGPSRPWRHRAAPQLEHAPGSQVVRTSRPTSIPSTWSHEASSAARGQGRRPRTPVRSPRRRRRACAGHWRSPQEQRTKPFAAFRVRSRVGPTRHTAAAGRTRWSATSIPHEKSISTGTASERPAIGTRADRTHARSDPHTDRVPRIEISVPTAAGPAWTQTTRPRVPLCPSLRDSSRGGEPEVVAPGGCEPVAQAFMDIAEHSMPARSLAHGGPTS